jgi:translation initiation factor IF-1
LGDCLPEASFRRSFEFFSLHPVAARGMVALRPIGRAIERYKLSEDHIEVEGVVSVVLPGTMFRVELDNKHVVLATISGKMRKRFVRLTVGDRVKMEMSPYDLNKARITWRLR